jgi:uncharacterized membrane protein YvlD (DUF360 family)
MIKIIKQTIINIVINSVMLYIISYYVPELWFSISSSEYDIFVTFWFLWIVLWLFNSILKRILKILTLPIKYITLWLSSLIINILIFYLFEYAVNSSEIWIAISMWTLTQVIILSLIITVVFFLIKKLI